MSVKGLMALAGFAVGLTFSELTAAHDLMGLVVEARDSASPELAAALANVPAADVNTKSVLDNLRLWPVPRKLTICFHGGSAALRKRVTEAMQKLWPISDLSQGRLGYDGSSFSNPPDCNTPATADIRLAFDGQGGYWSYVGVESRLHDPSMNLQLTENSPDTDFNEKVGHEMGHALGLQHEHQSPLAKCNWDFDWIWSNYKWESKEDMHFNLDRLQDSIVNGQHAYTFSSYDKSSLMHYSFPEQAFQDKSNDACFIPQNLVPSGQDKNAIQLAYGPDILARQSQTKSLSPELSKPTRARQNAGAHPTKDQMLGE